MSMKYNITVAAKIGGESVNLTTFNCDVLPENLKLEVSEWDESKREFKRLKAVKTKLKKFKGNK